MKKISIVFLILAAIAAAFTASAATIRASKNIVTERRAMKASYSKINASSAIKITIDPTVKGEILITAADNIIPYISTTLKDGELRIGLYSTHANRYNLNNTSIIVKIPESATLHSVKASGAASVKGNAINYNGECDIEASGAAFIRFASIKTATLDIEASGASKIELRGISVDKCAADISGASNATLAGAAQQADLEASGASSLRASELKTANAYVEATGASSATVYCTEKLVAEASGASSIKYSGNCATHNSTSGASSVRKL